MVRRSTWILLAALAGAALIVFGWNRFAPAPVEPTPTASPESPWSLLPEQVDSIRIVDLSGSAVVTVRRDPTSGWRLLSPTPGEADAGRVEAALTGALAPVVRQILAAGTDLEPYGLAPARFRLTLLMIDGTARSMEVGDLDPTGSVYYAMLPGDGRVLLISRFGLEDLLSLAAEPPYPPPTETPMASAEGTPAP
jgi:hypothetical protein